MSVHRNIDSDSDSDEGLVGRWSRLKQDARTGKDRAAEGAEPLEQESAAATRPVLTDADMPDPGTLQADSDFAAFLSPGVSEQLRTLALRRLFHLTGLHVPDGLDDYDEDFTRLPALGDTLTHDMRRMLARESSAEDQQPASTASQAVAEAGPADPGRPDADEQKQHAVGQAPSDDEPQSPA